MLPERRHVVKQRARARRTDKVGTLIRNETGAVNRVTTIHKNNTLDTGVEMLGTNRARRVEIVLDADVIAHLDRHTDATTVAMEKINIKTFANTTHATFATMIDIFVWSA